MFSAVMPSAPERGVRRHGTILRSVGRARAAVRPRVEHPRRRRSRPRHLPPQFLRRDISLHSRHHQSHVIILERHVVEHALPSRVAARRRRRPSQQSARRHPRPVAQARQRQRRASHRDQRRARSRPRRRAVVALARHRVAARARVTPNARNVSRRVARRRADARDARVDARGLDDRVRLASRRRVDARRRASRSRDARSRARRRDDGRRAWSVCARATPRDRSDRACDRRSYFIYARDRARSNTTSRSRRAQYERGARTIAATDRGRIPRRDRARARHSCTRAFLQCLPFSLPPSSAASPPSRRPRSKCVFFSLRATRGDAGTRRAETRRRGTRWDARDGMGSRATGRGDAGRARGEATALGRRERAERNDLNRRRRAGGRARARDARDARDTRFVAVSVSLSRGDSGGGRC